LTALSVAVRIGQEDVVVIISTKNAVLNAKDNFGRTRARRTKHYHIANLLLEMYKEKGINIQEDDLPLTLILVPSHKRFKICNFCVLGSSDKDTYYHYRVCNNRDFDICKEYFARAVCCLDYLHILIEEINNESA
jgi:hypothetical protein